MNCSSFGYLVAGLAGMVQDRYRPEPASVEQRCFRTHPWPPWSRHSPDRWSTGCCGAWCRAPVRAARRTGETKVGILLDTETTGLDHAEDEIIELGMVKFDCSSDGRIVGVRDTFSAFTSPAASFRWRLRNSRHHQRDGGRSQIRRRGNRGLRGERGHHHRA